MFSVVPSPTGAISWVTSNHGPTAPAEFPLDPRPPHSNGPVELAEDPVELAEDPVELAEDPVELAEDPVELAEGPVELAEGPVDGAVFGRRPVLGSGPIESSSDVAVVWFGSTSDQTHPDETSNPPPQKSTVRAYAIP